MAAAKRKPHKGEGTTRRALLDAASAILATEGAGALSVRRLAAEVGTSTITIYSQFGGMDGLLAGVQAEAAARFADALDAAEDRCGDPWVTLDAVGSAYRAFALKNPTYFRFLFMRDDDLRARVPQAAEEIERNLNRAYGVLERTITRLLVLQDRPAKDIEPMARATWSLVHGFVSLELHAPCPRADASWRASQGFVRRGLTFDARADAPC